MLYAINNDERVIAQPKAVGYCPACEELLVAKCGKIMIWHWAHKKSSNCEFHGEPETYWHVEWKSFAPIERQEVRMEKYLNPIDGVKIMITDILGNDGKTAIEVQHSPISINTIENRIYFYGKIVWVFDMADCSKRIIFNNHTTHWTFRWNYPRLSQIPCVGNGSKLFWDFGATKIFEVRKLHGRGGWGQWIGKNIFITQFIK